MRALFFTVLLAGQALGQVVPWAVETGHIPSFRAGDPAFVVLPQLNADALGLVIGTDTAQVGIYGWSLSGNLEQVLPVGLVNSADSKGSLLVVSSPANAVLTYENSNGVLTPLQSNVTTVSSPGQLVLAQDATGSFELWVDTSDRSIAHYNVSAIVNGAVSFTARPSIPVPEIPSGLAVDERTRRLYVGQPSLGILAVEPNGTANFVISIDGGQLGAAVGGIDVLPAANGDVVLFAVQPAEDRVGLHTISGGQATFEGSFEIGAPGGGVGRVGQPQFIDVVEQPVAGFPNGLLVVHDGFSANYKLVSLADVNVVVPLPATASSQSDGGVDGGGGGSVQEPPVTGRSGAGGPGGDVQPLFCGCDGGVVTFPALLLLWWIRRIRS